jgi:hypothetical protein
MADLHGWQSDPFGLHEQRYFSQGQPTKLVRDGGVEAYDPPPNQPGQSSPPPVSTREAAETPTLLPVPPRPGWWLASDGNWYPPETHPDATPVGPGWWVASDGNWYPPETHPDAAPAESVTGS